MFFFKIKGRKKEEKKPRINGKLWFDGWPNYKEFISMACFNLNLIFEIHVLNEHLKHFCLFTFLLLVIVVSNL